MHFKQSMFRDENGTLNCTSYTQNCFEFEPSDHDATQTYVNRAVLTGLDITNLDFVCMDRAGEWVISPSHTADCDQTCAGIGKVCDPRAIESLVTNERVGVAFAKAGHTCPGFGLDGGRFVFARDDFQECYRLVNGTQSTCNQLLEEGAAKKQLCYCTWFMGSRD